MEVLQVPSELERMIALYRERKPKRVLEIGCWDGGTLREWLTKGEPEVVVAVDLEHRNPAAYEGWRKPSTMLNVITGDSQDEETKAAIRDLAPFDWIFIDGDHSYEAAYSDSVLAMDCAIAEQTVVLFHDIADQEGEGPARVLADLARSFEVDFYVDAKPERWGHGIGVVWL